MTLAEIEKSRQKLQVEIDARKDIESRRQMGQFATPHELSHQIVSETIGYLRTGATKLRMLEPSMGIGSFVSSALMVMPERIEDISGYELDEDFHSAAVKIWSGWPVHSIKGDFTKAAPHERFDIVFANPPYVRHHAIGSDEKVRLQKLVDDKIGVHISGLAGLYCHFMLLSYLWMKPGAVGVWLIPTEWMTVNYGEVLREFLTDKVKLLRIHSFSSDDVRFSDALVSSCVVWFRKALPDDEDVLFTFGTNIEKPTRSSKIHVRDLRLTKKWPPRRKSEKCQGGTLGEHFVIRRGIATGDNEYFVLQEEDARRRRIPKRFLRPMLPSPRYLTVDHVTTDHDGVPSNAKRQFLFDCTGFEISDLPNAVREYLEFGANTTGKKRLCASRNVWYAQEQRQPTQFLCSYMGRGDGKTSPVRFILNDSKAIAANSFLMLYPKAGLKSILDQDPQSAEIVWRMMIQIPSTAIMASGRCYGGGLYKVEPKELANVPCKELADWVKAHG